ncbi:MAG: hypothetical protein GF418_09630 [Chitinivibrionales bacterium]|nr:hypothetical protein [Chitinivibrionales bacterium]MBD3395870.1 hypothetical protein [Chitinivibrionales bacterium]
MVPARAYVLLALLVFETVAANTPLSTELANACATGQFGKAMGLINDMADVNGTTAGGSTPLIETCRAGHFTGVMFLVTHGADVNLKAVNAAGTTPLIEAVRAGDARVVQFLLNRGAMVNKSDSMGTTPLAVAAQEGNEELVKLFLDKGADVEGRAGAEGARAGREKRSVEGPEPLAGASPLINAVEQGHMAVAKLLVDAGAGVNRTDSEGMTPLMFAALIGDLELVRYLVDNGADATVTDMRGRGAADYAAILADPSVSFYLVERGAPAPEGVHYALCFGLYRCTTPTAAFGTDPHYLWFRGDSTVYALSTDADSSDLASVIHINNPEMTSGTWTMRAGYLHVILHPPNQGPFYLSARADNGHPVAGTLNDGVLEMDVRSGEQWSTFSMRYTYLDVALYCVEDEKNQPERQDP